MDSRPGAARCTRCKVVTPYNHMTRRQTRSGRAKWYCETCWEQCKRLGIKV